jgi:sugar O-acyltransferase (sialic acid O-acetyltransferase NeuD family)
LLIIGAKGFAKEILQILHKKDELKRLTFYDDVNVEIAGYLYNYFPILKSKIEAQYYFSTVDNHFTIGIGNPKLRIKLYSEFTSLGGVFTSTIDLNTDIGSYGVEIGHGCNILSGAKISNDVHIGIGCIIYYNCIITHDVKIGNFVEASPNVISLGRCVIGNNCQIGSGSIILPDLKIGNNVIIGAGSMVTKDIPDNCLVFGSPAKVIKELEPIISN